MRRGNLPLRGARAGARRRRDVDDGARRRRRGRRGRARRATSNVLRDERDRARGGGVLDGDGRGERAGGRPEGLRESRARARRRAVDVARARGAKRE